MIHTSEVKAIIDNNQAKLPQVRGIVNTIASHCFGANDTCDASTLIAGGLIMGRVWGVREERKRRRGNGITPIVDAVHTSDGPYGYASIRMNQRGRKAYKAAEKALQRAGVHPEPLWVAVSEMETAAYRQGFAAAMQLRRECGAD